MTPRSFAALPALATLLLGLAACGGGGNDSPEGAVSGGVAAARGNDVATLVNTYFPPDMRAEMERGWKEMQTEPISDEQKAEFNMAMGMLTMSGAEDNLLAKIKPELSEAQQGVQQAGGMLAMVVGMGLAAKPELDDAEKQKAMETVGAVGQWLQGVDLTDEAKLRQAISAVCAGARDLGIANADQLRALSFDQALAKGGVALGALKKVTAIYGLDLDSTLDSISVGSPVVNGATAKVPTSITLFGKTFTSTALLEQKDGKWYPATPATH